MGAGSDRPSTTPGSGAGFVRTALSLGGVLGGQSGEGVLDAYSETRRKEFLEVSSPFAQTMKRMWSETDRAQQALDQAEIMKLSVGQSKISLAGLRRE